jgi:phospholipase C
MTQYLIQFLPPLILLILLIQISLSVNNSISAEPFLANENTTGKTPIKHITVIIQGRHSFDNYFGTFPNADGFPKGVRLPANPFVLNNSAFVEPFHLEIKRYYTPNDDPDSYRLSYNNGSMNGFVYANRDDVSNGRNAMGFFDDRDIPYYWQFASEYVLAQRFFGPSLRPDLVNNLYAIGANPPLNLRQVPLAGLNLNRTIFDELERNKVPWKVYIENYNSIGRDMTVEQHENLLKSIPILAIPRFRDNPSMSSHIDDLSNYFRDIRNNTLAAVNFVYFVKSNDSPTTKVRQAQALVSTLVYSLMKSHYWNSSAMILTHYESGGWYDHVKPPINNNTNELNGFRVPAIFISPFAKQGYIDNNTYDMSSVLKFIGSSFGIKGIIEMNNKTNNIIEAFDFTKPPREPIYLEEITREKILASSNDTNGVNTVYAVSLLVPIVITIYWYYKKRTIKVVKSAK